MNSTTSPPSSSCQTRSKFFPRELNNFQLLKKSVSNPCRSCSDILISSAWEPEKTHTETRNAKDQLQNWRSTSLVWACQQHKKQATKIDRQKKKKKKNFLKRCNSSPQGRWNHSHLNNCVERERERERERAEGSERLGQWSWECGKQQRARKEGRKARASEAGPGPQSLTRETTVLSFTQLCFFLYS
jgi:hypothetical protein